MALVNGYDMFKWSKRFFQWSSILTLIPVFVIFGLASEIITPDLLLIRSRRHFKNGIVNLNQYRFMLAIEDFTKAISNNIKNLSARRYLAKSYLLAGYSHYAVKEWQKYLEFNPSDIGIQNKLNLLYLQSASMALTNSSYDYLTTYPKEKIDFKRGIDIQIGPEGNIWVLGMESASLTEYNPNGIFMRRYSKGAETFGMPYGFAFGKDNIYISDYKNDMVHLISNSGRTFKKIGGKGSLRGFFHGPTGLDVSGDNFLYVADSGNDRVQKFNSQGKFIQSFGKSGALAGELDNPVDLAVSGENGVEYLYVLEKGNRRIQKFDIFGNAMGFWSHDLLKEPLKMEKLGENLFIGDRRSGLLYFNIPQESFFPFNNLVKSKVTSRTVYAVTKDRNNHFFLLDSLQNSIKVLAPKSYLRNNLNVTILGVDTSQFPALGILLKVKTPTGGNILHLNHRNLEILDERVKLYGINPRSFQRSHRALRLLILVDNSPEMKKYARDLDWILNPLFQKMYKRDQMQVIHFSDKIINRRGFDRSTRRTQREISRWRVGKGRNISKALYQAQSELAPLVYKKAIIVLTNGNFHESSFQQYSKETIVEYSQIHDIPVYVISFQGNDLEDLSKRTGGRLIRAYNTNEISRVLEKIREKKRNYYSISVATYKEPRLKDRFRKLKVRVHYRNQIGEDISGYINP